MNEPIDWTKPICLDTVPPRVAQVDTVWPEGDGASVAADWAGDGGVWELHVNPDGFVPGPRALPTVRNVRPGDFPATPATDIAAELAEALRWMIDNDDTNEGDEPLGHLGGRTWNEVNAYWIDGLNRARAALAKWEASQ